MKLSSKKSAIIIILLLSGILTACTEAHKEEIGSAESENTDKVVSTSDVWQGQHSSLGSRYDIAMISGDTIYGCYEKDGNAVISYQDKQNKILEKEITLTEMDYIQNMYADISGNVYVLGLGNEGSNLGVVNNQGEFSKLGNLELDDTENADFITARGIYADDNGNYYVWYRMAVPMEEVGIDDDAYVMLDRIYVKDAQFHTIFYEQVLDYKGSILHSFYMDAAGTPYIIAEDDKGLYVCELDVEQKKKRKVVYINQGMEDGGEIEAVFGTENGLLYCQNGELHYFLNDTSELKWKIKLESCGLYAQDILYCGIQGESIEVINNFGTGMYTEYTILKNERNEKTHISLGTMYTSQSLEKVVTEFNHYSEDTVVEIVSYYDAAKDYQSGVEKMQLDLIKGEAPDIIDVSEVNYEAFVDNGILVDLYEFMQADNELYQGLLTKSVLEAYEINDKLYSIAPSFQLYSMWGKGSVIQGKRGVTLSELMEILKRNGKDLNAISGFSADETVLTTLCTLAMDQFIDWDNSTCDFTGEAFKSVLDFAKAYSGADTKGGLVKAIKQGNVVMSAGMLFSVADYQIQSMLYENDVEFIGYPTSEGSGTAISFWGSQLAVNAGGEHQDAAWEFVKYYVLHGYGGQGFPVVTEVFEQAMLEAQKAEYTYVGNESYKVAKGIHQDRENSIQVYEATPEDIEAVRELVENASGKFKYNTSILKIIEEETSDYFSGQKDIEQITGLIQNRVQLFLEENNKD